MATIGDEIARLKHVHGRRFALDTPATDIKRSAPLKTKFESGFDGGNASKISGKGIIQKYSKTLLIEVVDVVGSGRMGSNLHSQSPRYPRYPRRFHSTGSPFSSVIVP